MEVIKLLLPEASSAGAATLFSPFCILLSDTHFQNQDYQKLGRKKKKTKPKKPPKGAESLFSFSLFSILWMKTECEMMKFVTSRM